LGSDPRNKTTVEVFHFFSFQKGKDLDYCGPDFHTSPIKKEMKNLYSWFFSRIASQWDGGLGRKKNILSNLVFEDGRFLLGSQIGLHDRKRSFERGLGEHA
jgi:hypothetical protein